MGVVTLDQVERQIARGFRLLRFAPDIEAAFRKDYAAERVRLAAIWGHDETQRPTQGPPESRA